MQELITTVKRNYARCPCNCLEHVVNAINKICALSLLMCLEVSFVIDLTFLVNIPRHIDIIEVRNLVGVIVFQSPHRYSVKIFVDIAKLLN